MPTDDLSNQRETFEFLREHFRTQETFTKSDLQRKTRWSATSITTYWSKQFEPFVKPVPPIIKGREKKAQKYRVTDLFRPVGTWSKFRGHVSQKRRLAVQYQHDSYDSVLVFEFFLPLTNEPVLRNSLDALFYRDTIQKRLLAIGFSELKAQFKAESDESDSVYLQRLIEWVGRQFGGYSVSHVSGRYRVEKVLMTMQEVASHQERAGRYLIDETTAVTRFIFPCTDPDEARKVSWFFHQLFVESVIQVAGEAEIWMIETGLETRLHIWRAKEEG